MIKCKKCLNRYICYAEEENCKDYLKDLSLELSPPVSNKEEVIIRLVESLNIGGEEADYKRVDIAFMQYEQIQKKLNAWKEF